MAGTMELKLRPLLSSYLFVYGTLMRGGKSPYARLLQARAIFTGTASVEGRLYNLGGFPGLVHVPGCGRAVHGEVYRLGAGGLLDNLDAYEGCRESDPEPGLFRRERIEARLANGSPLTVWTYLYTGETAGRPQIASGRFPLR